MNVKVDGSAPQQARERNEDPAQRARIDAARKFEGILMQQLLKVMRSTAKGGGMMSSEGASGQYMSMFDEVIAERMAEGGGIGLADSVLKALGGDAQGSTQSLASERSALAAARASQGGIAPAKSAVTAPLPNLQGATAKLAQAAYAISAPNGGKQWAREGTLTERDLASSIETPAAGGVARFSVAQAQGYRDAYKCNLFAFEAARRAGFEVPVVARAAGWGYPTSNTVTEDAQDGSLRGDWAQVVQLDRSGQKLADLQDKLAKGQVALMLTGSGSEGRHGHMAVVERIHELELDAHGEVKHIEFDGYEARVDGAQHLARRSWNRQGSGEDEKLARNGFSTIQLLALRPAQDPQAPEIRLSDSVRETRSSTP